MSSKANLLKQFDKSDLIKTMVSFLESCSDEKLVNILINDLHKRKYNRLVTSITNKSREYEKKYKCYENKSIPKKLLKAYGRFVLSFQKNEDELKAQRNNMIDIGLIKK